MLSPGKILYYLFYAPRRTITEILKRGPLKKLGDLSARLQMEASLRKVHAQTFKVFRSQVEICFLTGRKYWYQTAYCACSLQHALQRNLPFSFFDDGSLTKFQIRELERLFPEASLITYEEIQERLDAHLPREKFPSLRDRRLVYPHLSKLTDIHVGQKGWKLVLDSDMLFFAEPDELLEWIKMPEQPVHMIDTESAYGYSAELLEELAGTAVPERVNVGVTGLKSESIDWSLLESWCEQMLKQEGSHYLQEQALVAMLLAERQPLALPAAHYIVQPSEQEVVSGGGKLQHFTADSKQWYFRYGWQKAFALL